MAAKLLGGKSDVLLSLLLYLGVLAYINSSLMSNPRVMYAMGKDHVLPTVFSRQNKRNVLIVALSVYALISAVIVCWMEEFDAILTFNIFMDCFGFILSAGTIFLLRRKLHTVYASSIFRMKLYPLLPIVFIAAYIFIAVSIAVDYKNNHYAALMGIAVLLAFTGLYFVFNLLKDSKR